MSGLNGTSSIVIHAAVPPTAKYAVYGVVPFADFVGMRAEPLDACTGAGVGGNQGYTVMVDVVMVARGIAQMAQIA